MNIEEANMTDIGLEQMKEAIQDYADGRCANFSNKQFISWLSSLITTIESLQESFDRQVEGHKYTAGRYSDEMKETKRLNALVESQKEEIEAIKTILKQKIAILDQRVEARKGTPLFDEIPERAESFQDRAALYDEILSLFSQEGDK